MSADLVAVEPWEAARDAVDALAAAGILGRDPVVRAEALHVIEASIRQAERESLDELPEVPRE